MESTEQVRIPQDRETSIQMGTNEVFAWRYAYARAAETAAAGEPGQDYVAFRAGDATFVFALCDGVGQSFFGDLAARFLGDALVEWLWGLPLTLDADAVRSALIDRLIGLTPPATEQVYRQPIPPDAPTMLGEVLEQKRAMGSESTFVCGRVDGPGAAIADGRVVLAWMGDSRLRIWGPSGERTPELGETFRTAQRWSTRRGPVGGEPHVFVASVEQAGERSLTQFMAYSDGLAALDRLPRSPSSFALQDLITRAGQLATSDDISFLHLWLDPAFADEAARNGVATWNESSSR